MSYIQSIVVAQRMNATEQTEPERTEIRGRTWTFQPDARVRARFNTHPERGSRKRTEMINRALLKWLGIEEHDTAS